MSQHVDPGRSLAISGVISGMSWEIKTSFLPTKTSCSRKNNPWLPFEKKSQIALLRLQPWPYIRTGTSITADGEHIPGAINTVSPIHNVVRAYNICLFNPLKDGMQWQHHATSLILRPIRNVKERGTREFIARDRLKSRNRRHESCFANPPQGVITLSFLWTRAQSYFRPQLKIIRNCDLIKYRELMDLLGSRRGKADEFEYKALHSRRPGSRLQQQPKEKKNRKANR